MSEIEISAKLQQALMREEELGKAIEALEARVEELTTERDEAMRALGIIGERKDTCLAAMTRAWEVLYETLGKVGEPKADASDPRPDGAANLKASVHEAEAVLSEGGS